MINHMKMNTFNNHSDPAVLLQSNKKNIWRFLQMAQATATKTQEVVNLGIHYSALGTMV